MVSERLVKKHEAKCQVLGKIADEFLWWNR